MDRHPVSLSKFQEFALVLVKLRLAVPHQDLAYCLGISCAGVSRIPAAWCIILDIRFISFNQMAKSERATQNNA